MLAIYKRELKSYFQSMVGCVYRVSCGFYRNILYGV